MNALWERTIALLDRASKQHHVVALRDGMIASVPIILVGSTFLLLGQQGQVLKDYFPHVWNSGFGHWYRGEVPALLIPYRLTMGLLSLYIAFTIASCLARQYNLPPIPQGLGAVAALLVTAAPYHVPVGAGGAQWVMPLAPLGAKGIFLAILVGILMVEVSKRIIRPGTSPPTEEQVQGGIPPAVMQAFASFLPMLLVVGLVWFVRHGLGFDINHYINQAALPLKRMGDTAGCVVAVNVLLHMFGVAGVHGISVVNAVMYPIWMQFLVANAAAHTAGQPMPYVTAFPFYQWFVWIGGAGATLSPTVLLLRSRNSHMRRIGKMAIVPALFNINEPLLFGLPVVANPLLAIPFVLAPVVCGLIAYAAVSLGMVARPFLEAPWVMPCFLGGFLSTQDIRSVVLLAVNLAVSGVIWFPFLKAYERRLESAKVLDEQSGKQHTGGHKSKC